jgi:hypothetical protein
MSSCGITMRKTSERKQLEVALKLERVKLSPYFGDAFVKKSRCRGTLQIYRFGDDYIIRCTRHKPTGGWILLQT